MKVFVTGGTGFIGERVVMSLLKRGDSVHLLCRSLNSFVVRQIGKLNPCFGNVLDLSSIYRGMEGCEAVIHLAGYAKNWSRWLSTYYEVNVKGTQNVLKVAHDLKIKKVVSVSSIVVFGPSDSSPIDEQTVRTVDFFTEYERTKYQADCVGKQFMNKGLPLVTVYPTRVYGPGKDTEGNSLTRMLQLYIKGKFPFLLNGGRESANYVYVDNLVHGILLALDRGKVGGRYILGGENASLEQIFDSVDQILRRRHIRCSIPPAVARTFSMLAEWGAEVFGVYPQITSGWVETFLRNWIASSALAVQELGYRPIPLRLGLEKTLQWLEERGGRQ